MEENRSVPQVQKSENVSVSREEFESFFKEANEYLEEAMYLDVLENVAPFIGKIKDIRNFGALIQLDEETTGLIQTTYINKNSKKLTVGDEIKVKVISLIRDDRKIYLNFADAKSE